MKLKYRVIERFRMKYAVKDMCGVFGVSRSGYYAWRKQQECTPKDQWLVDLIVECQQKCNQTYGCRRVKRWLERFKGKKVNLKAILRIMRKLDLLSQIRRRKPYTHYKREVFRYENLLKRQGFSAELIAYAFSLYGITTILGSVISGFLCSRFAMKRVLGYLYGSRTVLIIGFMLLPKSLLTIYGYAAVLGLTGAATVPPTSGLVNKLYGTIKLGTLFGVAFVAHQIGSFFSAWLGGLCLSFTGSYSLIWCTSAVLSLVAATVSFFIKEEQKFKMGMS